MTFEKFDAAINHTGANIEQGMRSTTESLVELKSQIAELRDYLLGPRGVSGSASNVGTQPDGFFGRLAELNYDHRQLIAEIQDMVLEVRNQF